MEKIYLEEECVVGIRGMDLTSPVDFVRLFRQSVDQEDRSPFLAAVQLAIHDKEASDLAARAADLLQAEPDEKPVYLQEMIARCTDHSYPEGDFDPDDERGPESAGVNHEDVLFISCTGTIQDIQKMIEDPTSRTRIEELLVDCAKDKVNAQFFVSDLLLDPEALLEAACTEFSAMRKGCDALRSAALNFMLGFEPYDEDYGILRKLANDAAAEVRAQGSTPIYGARLVPVVMVQLADADEKKLHIDDLFSNRGVADKWFTTVGDLYRQEKPTEFFAINWPAPLVSAAQNYAMDYLATNLLVRQKLQSPPGGFITPAQGDPSMLSFRISDGTEAGRLSKRLVDLTRGEVCDRMYTLVGGRLTDAPKPESWLKLH